jgi:hypothetical protein
MRLVVTAAASGTSGSDRISYGVSDDPVDVPLESMAVTDLSQDEGDDE